MFSVASNFDDELPGRLVGMEADELFGSCDDAPVGHGRPRAMIPPSGQPSQGCSLYCFGADIGSCAISKSFPGVTHSAASH